MSKKNKKADHNHPSVGHAVPLSLLAGVAAALMILTIITVAARYIDLGDLNIWIAMGIATIKAALVVLFFMHLAYDRPFNAVVFVTSLVFLFLFLAGTITDTIEYQPSKIPNYAPEIERSQSMQ